MKIKKALIALLYFYANSHAANAQSIHSPVSLAFNGAGAYSIKNIDAFSFCSNQASLSRVHKPMAGIYGEQRFMLTENRFCAAVLAMPGRLGNFGVQLNYAGFKNFNENKIGLAYARNLGSRLDIGIQFNYETLHIAGHGNASAVNAEAGFIIHFNNKLHAGVQVINPLPVSYSGLKEEKTTAVYKLGLGYEASDLLFFSMSLTKEENKNAGIETMLQYSFMNRFFARAGFGSGASIIFAGAGTAFGRLRLIVSASHHPQLGISPGILFLVNIKSDSK